MPPAGSGFQSDNTGHLCSSLISARPWLDGPEAAAAPPPPPLAPASCLPSGSGEDRGPASFSLVQLQRRLHSQEATTPAHPGLPDPPQLPRGPAGRPRAWAPGGAGREGSRATLWALPRLNQVIGAQRASSPESRHVPPPRRQAFSEPPARPRPHRWRPRSRTAEPPLGASTGPSPAQQGPHGAQGATRAALWLPARKAPPTPRPPNTTPPPGGPTPPRPTATWLADDRKTCLWALGTLRLPPRDQGAGEPVQLTKHRACPFSWVTSGAAAVGTHAQGPPVCSLGRPPKDWCPGGQPPPPQPLCPHASHIV